MQQNWKARNNEGCWKIGRGTKERHRRNLRVKLVQAVARRNGELVTMGGGPLTPMFLYGATCFGVVLCLVGSGGGTPQKVQST